jgi:hypothetical protein
MDLDCLYLSVTELCGGFWGRLQDLLLTLGMLFRRVLYLSEEELLNDRFDPVFSICEDLVGEEWEPVKMIH